VDIQFPVEAFFLLIVFMVSKTPTNLTLLGPIKGNVPAFCRETEEDYESYLIMLVPKPELELSTSCILSWSAIHSTKRALGYFMVFSNIHTIQPQIDE
jgi:hypothetical protein